VPPQAELPETGPPGTGLRRRVAALAGHTGDVDAARDALDDESPAVRATALGALSRLDALNREDWRAAARDGAPEVRARAAELSVSRSEPEVAVLIGLLSDRSAQVVEAACFALGEIGTGAEAAVAALSAVAVEHREPLLREAAVAALGAIGDPGGLGAILHATSDKPAVRRRAVIALAPFAGEAVDAALERALEDRDWQVRQAAEDLTGRGS